MKNVVVLGSTGSIGVQTLEVIEKLEDFKVIALACGNNIELLNKQIEKFSPEKVCISNKERVKEVLGCKNILFDKEGLIELVRDSKADIIVVATSGIVSVKAVLEAIKNKKTIALANKETLVMAGDIVMQEVKKHAAILLPIDSEHSAILQCLNSYDNPFAERLWITASGGPFLNNSREEMKDFKVKDALNHPRWSMGKKITVDCSTLVNKGLEVIEAHHLYNFNYDDIKVIIHPQSLIHSMVEFSDGSFLAQMGVPSMHIPIQYALTYPKRCCGIKSDSFIPFNNKLEFFEPDYKKFPLLKLTIDCGKMGGIMPAVLNAVNEVAVYKFLRGEIGFLDIEKIIFNIIEKEENILNPSLDEIFEIDKKIREKVDLI